MQKFGNGACVFQNYLSPCHNSEKVCIFFNKKLEVFNWRGDFPNVGKFPNGKLLEHSEEMYQYNRLLNQMKDDHECHANLVSTISNDNI